MIELTEYMTEKVLVLTDKTIENYFDYCLEIKIKRIFNNYLYWKLIVVKRKIDYEYEQFVHVV